MKICRNFVVAFYLLLASSLFCATMALADDTVLTRRIDGQNAATGSELRINQVDTSSYPKVTIFATVLKDRVPVTGLSQVDFRVREDEVDQEPLTVVPKLTSLNVVVTLDTSGSIRKDLPKVQTAATTFLDVLGTEDKFNVISFARTVQVLSNSDRDAAKKAIQGTVARGDTALYDALYQSVEVLQQRSGRKAVILLTDGVDDDGTGGQLSKHSVAEAIAIAKTVNVPVFAIGLGTEKDEVTLKKMASETGGKYFDAPSVEQLQEIYDAIGKELSGQYNIYYASNLPDDGTVRRVTLSSGENRSSKEYTAPAGSSTVVVKNEVVKQVDSAPAAPVAAPVAAVNEVTSVVISNAPGLHVAAQLVEGGEVVEFDSVRIYNAPSSAFQDKKQVHTCYNKKACSTTVANGTYLVEIKRGAVTVEKSVEIQAGQANNLPIVLNAGVVNIIASPSKDSPKVKVDRFEAFTVPGSSFDSEARLTNCYNNDSCSFTVPAGKVRLEAKLGSATSSEVVEITAGQMQNVALNLGAGKLSVRASFSEGGEHVKENNFEVYRPSASGFDKPERIENCYNKQQCDFVLPIGEYEVRATNGEAVGSQKVTIEPSKGAEVVVVLGAGQVNVVATTGGSRIRVDKFEILSSPENNFDQPKRVSTCMNKEQCSFTLNAGKYRVVAEKGGAQVTKDLDLPIGQIINVEMQLVQ